MKMSLSAARRSGLLRRAIGVGIFEQLEQRRMLSVTPLGPIPSETTGSNPSQFFAVGGTTLFFADDSTGQQHLYKTDGTTAGTQLVSTQGLDNSTSGGQDVAVSGNNLFYISNVGGGDQIEEASVQGSNVTVSQFTNINPDNNLDRYTIEGVATVGSNIYFVTNVNSTSDTPLSLWVSNGTTSTNLGSFSEINEVSGINGKTIFAANDSTDGEELWVTDGTVLGTTPLQQSGGADVGAPVDFVADGTNLFFVANGGSLFYTDGTEAGTNPAGPNDVAVNGTAEKTNSSEHLSVLSGDVYYSNDGYLYKTTADGHTTAQVADTVYNVYYLEPMGANIYFQGNDGTHGAELWKSDGTSGGTEMVEDINPGAGSSFPEGLTASGNELFFQAEPDANHDQIFATDGTTVTQLTQTFNGADDFENSISSGGNGVAYTSIDDNFHGNEPFKLTATTASLLADINTTPNDNSEAPNSTAQVGNILYFVSGNNDDQTLWKTDGTAAGTVQVNITVSLSTDTTSTTAVVNGLNIDDLLGGTSTLYFRSNADGTNNALWTYNGTTAAPVKAVLPDSATPVDVTVTGDSGVVGNTLFFVFNDGTHGNELWKSDGTTTGTTIVKDIDTVDNGSGGTNSSSPGNLWAFGNKLLFTADDGLGQKQELWVTDGTSAGTMVIKHLLPGTTTNLDIIDLAVVGNIAYFDVNQNGQTLWKTDGTAAGTIMLAKFDELELPDFGPDGDTDAPPVINGNFFFNATSFTGSDAGEALWKTDGTPAGTVLVKSGRSGDSNSGGFDPDDIINLNPTTIVFSAYGPDGEELWKSDGTTAGTVQVADINAGKADSDPEELTVLNGEVYFSAITGNNGVFGEDRELWKSDGTAAGTTEVKQLYTRTGYYTSGGADIENITVVGSKIFFTANDSVHGQELWQTDGTAAGTSLVQDINDTDSSFPFDFTPVVTPTGDNALVFFANDGTNGAQPFSVVVPSYALNVSTTSLSVPENGSNTFTVDLTSMPASNVTVTIGKETGGSADLNTAATTLTFTPANWDVPQTVTVTGALEDGALNGTATFDVSSPNLTTDTVAATEVANTTGIVVISSNAVNVPEGGTGTFSVHLSAAPVGQVTVSVAFAAGDNVLSSAPATLVFNASNYAADQVVTLSSGTDSDTTNQTATFTVSAAGFPNQTVTATQIDHTGPHIGTFTVNPASGTSKSTIKLLASGITGDNGTGSAKSVIFYIDTNDNGVLDSGDAALKTVKPSKKGTAAFSLKAKTLSTGQTTFFAQGVDSSGAVGQPVSGTFTLNATTSVKKSSARKNAPMILANNTETSDTDSGGITQSMFSQTSILG